MKTAASIRIAHRTSPITGELEVPGDKSISHRSVLLASLAGGASRLENLLESADVLATVACARRLGVRVTRDGTGVWTVRGRGIEGYREAGQPLDCRNSGTTARLLAGLLAATPAFSVLTGDASLRRRPMMRVVQPLRNAGASIAGRDGGRLLPLAIQGRRLDGFDAVVPEPSAQVKTALLLAALKARGRSRVTQAAATRDHTERLFEYLSVPFSRDGDTLELSGPSEPRARDLTVPGDPSSAAFFLVAGLLVPGSRVTVRGVCLNPTRLGFARVLRRMGARLTQRVTGEAAGEPVGELVAEHSQLRATSVASEEVPSLVDEVPILAVAAARAEGVTWFRGVGELRAKESDRLAVLETELSALGAGVAAEGDDLRVTGPRELTGARLASHGDHRMAMAFSIAALAADGETEVAGNACVKISFPDFYERLAELLG